MKPVAVFASGRGSNFEALLRKQKQGRLKIEFRLIVASRPDAGIIRTAELEGIPCHVQTAEETAADLLDVLRRSGSELLLLAGYMKKLPPEIVDAFPGAILNVHPALLPAFGGQGCYGLRVHEKVLEAGVKVTGVTVHFVDNEYDHGPIVLQRAVEVLRDDTPVTLQARVLRTEHDLYWRGVDLVAREKVRIEGRRVVRN